MCESRISVIHVWEAALPFHIKLVIFPIWVMDALNSERKMKTNSKKRSISSLSVFIHWLADIITGFEGDGPIEAQIGSILTQKQSSIAVAESCTGGRIAALLSSIPASVIFWGCCCLQNIS